MNIVCEQLMEQDEISCITDYHQLQSIFSCLLYAALVTGAHKRCKAAQRSVKLIVLTVVEFHNPNNSINGKLLITFMVS